MPLSIRKARSADLDDLVALLWMLFSIEKDFLFDQEKQRRGLQQLLDLNQAVILVAEMDDHVVGMCSGQIVISTAEGGPSVLVEDMTVAEEFQGRGIGKKLLQGIESWAREQGAYRLQLLADRNNEAALKFYQKTKWSTTDLICLRRRIT